MDQASQYGNVRRPNPATRKSTENNEPHLVQTRRTQRRDQITRPSTDDHDADTKETRGERKKIE